MDFRIWASVQEIAPGRYFVTVSAVSAEEDDRTGGVESAEASSRKEANGIRDRLVALLATKLRTRGHHVVDVKLD